MQVLQLRQKLNTKQLHWYTEGLGLQQEVNSVPHITTVTASESKASCLGAISLFSHCACVGHIP